MITIYSRLLRRPSALGQAVLVSLAALVVGCGGDPASTTSGSGGSNAGGATASTGGAGSAVGGGGSTSSTGGGGVGGAGQEGGFGPVADCGASVLSDAASQLVAGSFVELSMSGYDSALLDAGSSHHILQYSDKGVWDPNTCQALFVGGGHLSQVKYIAYRGSDNTWFHAPNPSWWCDTSQASNPYDCASHAYGHNALDPATGTLFFRLFNRADIYRHQVDGILDGVWDDAPALPSTPAGCIATALEYFPEMDKLVYVDCAGQDAYVLGPTDGSWQVIDGPFSMGAYHNYAVYNRIEQTVMFGAGNGSGAFHLLRANGSVTPTAVAPHDFHPEAQGSDLKILTVDPAGGDYLAYARNGEMWRYDVGTDSWSALSVSAPTDLNVAIPISSYNVVMFLQQAPAKVWLYKHSGP
ncbi:MAG: hypothetical protein KC731_02775 [Myxococcales bacterium]|nr:hypothetical protein [Myxococcales bacterium]